MDLGSYWWQLDAWSRRSAQLLYLQQEPVNGTWVTHNAWLNKRLHCKKLSKWAHSCYHWPGHPLTHAGYKSSDTKHFAIELDLAVQSHVSARAADLSHLLTMTAVTHAGYLVFLPWLGYTHDFFPWGHSHTLMWQNPHRPNRRWPGHCRTVSHV